MTGYVTGEVLSSLARSLTDTAPNSQPGCRKDSPANGGPGSPGNCLRDCPQDKGPDDIPGNFADYSGSNPPSGGGRKQTTSLRPQAASR